VLPHHAFVLVQPDPSSAPPIVIDSPHSGTDYPADFGSVLDVRRVRTAIDAMLAALAAHVRAQCQLPSAAASI
jgi:N-formylglutamate deformylase